MSTAPRAAGGVLAIDAQVAFFVGREPALVAPGQGMIEPAGNAVRARGRIASKNARDSIHDFQSGARPADGRGPAGCAGRGP